MKGHRNIEARGFLIKTLVWAVCLAGVFGLAQRLWS